MPHLFDLPQNTLPPLFRIGAQPLGDAPRFVAGADVPRYLAEKQRLAETRFREIFLAEPETEAAQNEVLVLISTELQTTVPEASEPPLWTAAQLVAEDLIIMQRDADTWRLTAGALCFPSAWRLSEKIGKPLDALHAPVPGFAAGTRNAEIMARMFDALRPEAPILRGNWSLYGDDVLFHPDEADPDVPRFGPEGDRVFLRGERQTLSKLPQTGAILFTIRIFVTPLETLLAAEGGADLATQLRAELERFDAEQLAYKGLTADRNHLINRLRQLAD